jgi:hypothetical protein
VKLLLCKAALAVGVLLLPSGCAFLASANAAHSHITPCVDDLSFALIDLVLAGAATGVLVGTGALDESPAWMALPGVFVTSGVVGSIYVHKCRGGKSRQESGQPMPVYDRGPDYTPTQQRASELPDATPEDMGFSQPAVPPADPRLQLPPDSSLKEPPPRSEEAAKPPGTTTPSLEERSIMCGYDLTNTCPAGMACRLVADGRGFCVKEEPKAEAAPPRDVR